MNNKLVFLILVILITIGTLYFINKKSAEPLCVNPIDCGTKELQKVLEYDLKTEPNNPFYTHEMVVPKMKDFSFEKEKLKYLEKANIVYQDLSNDLLNANLVPKRDYLFVYP